MAKAHAQSGVLYYGDNLRVLREYVPAESVDLIYLDPPFNSRRGYNVLFAEQDAAESEAQVRSFEDTWRWDRSAQQAYDELTGVVRGVRPVSGSLATMMVTLRGLLGTSDLMAYLVMMTVRLVELHRVLKPTGSLYLHCDPTASHYLKVVLDAVFGTRAFVSEIVWKRTGAHGSARRWAPVHDVLLMYAKGREYTWTDPRGEPDPNYLAKKFTETDAQTGRRFQGISLTGDGIRAGDSGKSWRGFNPTALGRHWAVPSRALRDVAPTSGTAQSKLDALDGAGKIKWPAKQGGWPRLKWFADELTGAALPDVWADIEPLNSQAKERLGYQTQKPRPLLDRILRASSNPDDVVLDPFCGCGTAIEAAQALGRRWIGIDVTYLAIDIVQRRLKAAGHHDDYKVVGEPADLSGARTLAQSDKYEFQWWALHCIGARPLGVTTGRKGKKGADRGIDGILQFRDDPHAQLPHKAIVSIKGGGVNSAMIRDLRGTIEREGAEIGVFLTLESPTREMRLEATAAGSWHSAVWGRDYPRIQIVTIADALKHGHDAVKLPGINTTHRHPSNRPRPATQSELLPGIGRAAPNDPAPTLPGPKSIPPAVAARTAREKAPTRRRAKA